MLHNGVIDTGDIAHVRQHILDKILSNIQYTRFTGMKFGFQTTDGVLEQFVP